MFYLQKLYWHFLCYMRCRSSSLSLFAYRMNDSITHVGENKEGDDDTKNFFWCQTRYGIAAAAGDFGESRVVLNQHKLALLGRFFFLSCPHTPFFSQCRLQSRNRTGHPNLHRHTLLRVGKTTNMLKSLKESRRFTSQGFAHWR